MSFHCLYVRLLYVQVVIEGLAQLFHILDTWLMRGWGKMILTRFLTLFTPDSPLSSAKSQSFLHPTESAIALR